MHKDDKNHHQHRLRHQLWWLNNHIAELIINKESKFKEDLDHRLRQRLQRQPYDTNLITECHLYPQDHIKMEDHQDLHQLLAVAKLLPRLPVQ